MDQGQGTAQNQLPVLTITLNPALDLTTAADAVVPDLKLRCAAPMSEPGGGGINVSRAIAVMGGRSTALVALGGLTGQKVAALLAEAGIATLPLPAPGETRQSLVVQDRASSRNYRFVLPGPEWRAPYTARMLVQIVAAAPARGYVVLSGSNPPGVPADFARHLAKALSGQGARLIVDTSGAALAAVTAFTTDHPFEILRMDDQEAEGLAGHPLPQRADTAAFARMLLGRNIAKGVVIARGRDGNILATAQGCWHAKAEKVRIISTVGAGDSFVGGFTLGLARGWPIPDALGLAAAAASATVQMPGSQMGRAEVIRALYDARIVTQI